MWAHPQGKEYAEDIHNKQAQIKRYQQKKEGQLIHDDIRLGVRGSGIKFEGLHVTRMK